MPTDTAAQYHVYGNGGSGPVDYGVVLATVDGVSWQSPALGAGTSWAWAVRAFDPVSGLEETNVDRRAYLVLDAGRADVTNLPPPPSGVSATPAANGSLRVTWAAAVVPRDPRRPTRFTVHVGTGGTPDYATPAASVTAVPGVTAYTATVTGLTGGVEYAVGVRAANAAGVEANTATATATALTAGPAAVGGLTADLI